MGVRIGGMRVRGWRLGLAVVVTIAMGAASAAPASAASVTLGSGHHPALAVDDSGTAYVAWRGLADEPLYFCRLPRGAQGCAAPVTLAAPGKSVLRPFVAVSGSTVWVFSFRYSLPAPSRFEALYRFTSVDGGATFDGGVAVGTLQNDDAIVGPGAGVSVVKSGEYQWVPLEGNTLVEKKTLLVPNHPYTASVALLDPSTPLALFSEINGTGQFRRYSGSGNLNDAASWAPAQSAGRAERNRLAGGPAGLFLMDQVSQGGPFEVRRFDGTGFGPGTAPPLAAGSADQELTQDPAGRLHALWPGAQDQLLYATSDDGTNWTTGELDAGAGRYAAVQAAAASDHVGAVVWETTGTASEVRLAQFGPTPPVAKPDPVGPPDPVAPYQGPRRTVRVSDRQGTFKVLVPEECVLPGQRFRVKLSFRRKRGKGNRPVAIRRAVFRLGGRRVGTDRKAPFRHDFLVPAGQPAGSKLKVEVRARLDMRRGPDRSKAIRLDIEVCP